MVKFNKYKDWLQIHGYNVERIDKYAPPLQCYCYTFSNGTKYKYWVNIHCDRNLNVSNNIRNVKRLICNYIIKNKYYAEQDK